MGKPGVPEEKPLRYDAESGNATQAILVGG